MASEWHLEYEQRRSKTLWRLRHLHQLGAPRFIIRNEQMFLWGFRQFHYHPEVRYARSFSELPGFRENHDKFIKIHQVDVNNGYRH